MIPKGQFVAFDTETTGLAWRHGDQAFACSFCNDRGETGYIEWPVDPYTRVVLYDERLQRVREWLADKRVVKIMHNRPFDKGVMEIGAGCTMLGETHDTMLMVHSCFTALGRKGDQGDGEYGLKPLAKSLCGIDDDDEKELNKATIKYRREAQKRGFMIHEKVKADMWLDSYFNEGQLVRRYATRDAERTMYLWLLCMEHMSSDPQAVAAYEFEQTLAPILEKMCNAGIRFDRDANTGELQRCIREERVTLEELRNLSGRADFNPDSPFHVREFLFDKLKIPVVDYTPSGLPQATQESLANYRHQPAVQTLFKYRGANKGRTAFFTKYDRFKARSGNEWVIYPNFKQAGKRTGRLSMTDPNLQGAADKEKSRSENPIDSRKPFGPRDGYVWYLIDHSQLEVRIFAAFSQEPVLLDVLRKGLDLHTVSANKSWGGDNNPRAVKAAMDALEIGRNPTDKQVCEALKKFSQPDVYRPVLQQFGHRDEQMRDDAIAYAWLKSHDFDIVKAEASIGKKNSRSRGKTIFFARMFFGGPNTIMKRLHCTKEEAVAHIADYDAGTPGVIRYNYTAQKRAKKLGHIVTAYGRRLDVPRDETHKAASYEVQGSAADLIKREMVEIDHFFQKMGLDARIVLQIHDELIIEIKRGQDRPFVLRAIRDIMEYNEKYIGFPVPVSIERTYISWSDTEKVTI